MSVELVTGYSGVGSDGEPNRHVSSADDGARQAGTVGTGMYVLGTGSRMSASMEDANTLVVADGDAMINGRHVRIPDTLSFTIPTGVQGQKVANLAVLRYSKAADSVESVTPRRLPRQQRRRDDGRLAHPGDSHHRADLAFRIPS